MGEVISKERVMAAVRWKDVDCIPVFANKSPMGPALIGKKLNRDFSLSADSMTRSELALFEIVDDDVICLNLAPAIQDPKLPENYSVLFIVDAVLAKEYAKE